ncbi:MAG: hypothetical protein HC814_02430, partial [Rhodobacteraceae bacterium]|nr:hypothetical protein [Paracoccaceae bacterium]
LHGRIGGRGRWRSGQSDLPGLVDIIGGMKVGPTDGADQPDMGAVITGAIATG